MPPRPNEIDLHFYRVFHLIYLPQGALLVAVCPNGASSEVGAHYKIISQEAPYEDFFNNSCFDYSIIRFAAYQYGQCGLAEYQGDFYGAMSRWLDVQYLYRERAGETDRKQGIKLTSQMLAELPRKLLEELRQTPLILDREATLRVIERLEAQAPDTAEGLRILVHDFQMGGLGELLREKGNKEKKSWVGSSREIVG